MNNSNIESLAKASKDLCLKAPFYGLFLMSLNKIWNPHLKTNGQGTAGVGMKGINIELHIEPEFWFNLPAIHKLGIINHELLHIAMFHLTDYENYHDKKILNYAMDIEINQMIDRSWLPENGCFLEKFPELEMKKHMGTRYYYEKLMEAKDSGNAVFQNIIESLCNGGLNGESTITLPNGEVIDLVEHDWSDIAKLDETTRKLVASQLGHVLINVADQVTKSRGVIPGEIKEILAKITHIEPPKFDWKGYIRRFVGNSTRTYLRSSRRKYNIRLPDNPGNLIKQEKHMFVVIDTSASVVKDELREFFNELHHIYRTGCEVTICQCDTQINDIRKFNPKEDIEIHGRGGTDFQPPIDYYNENSHKYSCLIYFTDGECPAPENPPRNLLWVLSERSHMNEDLPGKVIKLEL